MDWLRNLTVARRLILGFGLMILVVGTIGVAGYTGIKSINDNLQEVFKITIPSIDYLLQADRDLYQALVAERTMVFADPKSDNFKKQLSDYESNVKQADERWEKYKKLASTSREKSLISEYEKARNDWKVVSRKAVDAALAGEDQGRIAEMSIGAASKKFEEMRGHLDKLQDIDLDLVEEFQNTASSTYRKPVLVLTISTGVGLLMSILIAWLLARGISGGLRKVICGLEETSEGVASASSQVFSSSRQLADGASQQAASLEETTASLEEIASMTKQNAGNASQANQLVTEASRVVEQANHSMNSLTSSMAEISRASEETQKIIKTIDEIAFQTNLLALNAAVEAARAGEAGAGFAVVADEVRNLAMRAAEAAKNTSDLIEGTVKKIKEGSDLVGRTNEEFRQVVATVSKSGELVGEIAEASREQTQGIEQINSAVSNMDRVTQLNASNAGASASASEEMNVQAEQMRELVSSLVSLVGGNADQKGTRKGTTLLASATNLGRIAVSARPFKKTPTDSGKSKGTHNLAKPTISRIGAKEVNPEQVIPFDESEFKDF